jgi:hypothetical protein
MVFQVEGKETAQKRDTLINSFHSALLYKQHKCHPFLQLDFCEYVLISCIIPQNVAIMTGSWIKESDAVQFVLIAFMPFRPYSLFQFRITSKIMNPLDIMVWVLGWKDQLITRPLPTQDSTTWTHIHALSGIQTHNSSVWAASTHALDWITTVNGTPKLTKDLWTATMNPQMFKFGYYMYQLLKN